MTSREFELNAMLILCEGFDEEYRLLERGHPARNERDRAKTRAKEPAHRKFTPAQRYGRDARDPNDL